MISSSMLVFKTELLQFIRTGKGVLFACLIILLSLTCAVTGVVRYKTVENFIQSKSTEYDNRIKKAAKGGAYDLVTSGYHCINKPTPLYLISGTRRIEAPREYVFSPIDAYWMVLMSGWTDPMSKYVQQPPPVFEMKEMNLDDSLIDFDFTFIVQLFIPFCLILIGFDSICRDRSEGRLRLTIISASSRLAVWLGKWMFLAIISVTSVLLAALIFFPIITFAAIGNVWILIPALITISAISVGYLILWAFIILLISTVVNSGAKSLTVLITLLLLFNVIIPSTIRFVTDNNSTGSHRQLYSNIKQEVLSKTLSFKQNKAKLDSDMNWNMRSKGLEHADIISDFVLENALFIEEKCIEYDRKCIDQLAKAELFSIISPSLLYRYVAENSCGSGTENFYRFNSAILQYNRNINNFIKKMDRKDPDSKHGYFFKHPGLSSTKPIEFNSIPKFEQLQSHGLRFVPWKFLFAAVVLTLCMGLASIITFMRLDV